MEPSRPASAVPPANRHSIYRLMIPGAALLLYGVLAALWLWGPHAVYFDVLRLLAFEPFHFPFLDIHAVLAAAQCHRLGVDVYLTNPCDALGRVHVYSPLWLRITPGFLDASDTTVVGLGLGLLFIGSLTALCRRTTLLEVLPIALTVLSPMTVYAVERANNDLVIFLLILVGCGLLQLSRPMRFAGYTLFFSAGLLKYYPLILLATVLRERRRDAIALAATAAAILVLAVLCNHTEIARAVARIPAPSYFADSFAAVNLPFGFAETLGAIPYRRTISLWLLAALAAALIARVRRSLAIVDRAALDWRTFEADCLVVGALLLMACFFAGQNVDYRGVYFVLVMPGLLHLRRIVSTTEVRRFLSCIAAGVLFVAWEEVLRRLDYAATAYIPIEALKVRAELLFWLGRELVWWWLIAGLAAIVLSYLRQLPLVSDAVARLPTFSLLPRQRLH
jgi:hypothetical protein